MWWRWFDLVPHGSVGPSCFRYSSLLGCCVVIVAKNGYFDISRAIAGAVAGASFSTARRTDRIPLS
jgi:hypothetical protein